MSTVGTLYDETIKFGRGKLLGTLTASNSASLAWSSVFDPAIAPEVYDVYYVELLNILPVNNSVNLYGRMSNASGVMTTGYYWNYFSVISHPGTVGATPGNASGASTVENQAFMYFSSGQYNGAASGVSGEIFINRIGNNMAFFSFTAAHHSTVGEHSFVVGGLNMSGTGPLRGLQFYYSTGNIASGKLRLYGMKTG